MADGNTTICYYFGAVFNCFPRIRGGAESGTGATMDDDVGFMQFGPGADTADASEIKSASHHMLWERNIERSSFFLTIYLL